MYGEDYQRVTDSVEEVYSSQNKDTLIQIFNMKNVSDIIYQNRIEFIILSY